MTLTIRTSVIPPGPAILTSPQNLRSLTRTHTDRTIGKFEVVGLTIPHITYDFMNMHFHTREENGNKQFRFDRGTLTFTLTQEIYVSNALDSNVRPVWEAHEREHAQDNEAILGRMDTELRSDSRIQAFINRDVWNLYSHFAAYQQAFSERINATFRRLTEAAAKPRDTAEEYHRVEEKAKGSYIPPLRPNLHKGNKGPDVAALQTALNREASFLPPIAVDGDFGGYTELRLSEFQLLSGMTISGVGDEETLKALGLKK